MRRLAVTVLLALALPVAARAQISPGELTRAHEALEGMKNCLKCHELGAGPSAEKCLECHQEIASMIEKKKGYHHRVVGIGRQACFECHGEHAGRSFDIVHWPDGRDRFDHTQAGWPLSGAHAKLECRQCHKADFVPAAFTKAHGSVDVSKTFLGLGQACEGCHKDPHAGQFVAGKIHRECAECHSDDAWKTAARFDHAKTAFPLRGRHRETDCAKCHETVTRRGANVVQFAGVAHESCTRCHKDPHAGRLGANCASCHGEDAWKPVTRFDHAKTDFPLTGKHVEVACEKCHTSAANADAATLRYAGLPHDNCTPCHKDVHDARLGANCSSCHTTAGWTAAAALDKRDGFDHGKTRYPLVGMHRTVKCEKCHRDGSKTAAIAFDTCERCHKDPHAGQFVSTKEGGACERCHDVGGFVPARYTTADHAKTRFVLAGAHLAQPCVACHKVDSFPSGARCRRFVFADVACASCHRDPHAGQFTTAPAKACGDCHTNGAWKELDFDHDRDTRYRLEGQHRAVACAKCHVETSGAVRYRSTPTRCEACHTGEVLQLGGRS